MFKFSECIIWAGKLFHASTALKTISLFPLLVGRFRISFLRSSLLVRFTVNISHINSGLSLCIDLKTSAKRRCKQEVWIDTKFKFEKSSCRVFVKLNMTTRSALTCVESIFWLSPFEENIQISGQYLKCDMMYALKRRNAFLVFRNLRIRSSALILRFALSQISEIWFEKESLRSKVIPSNLTVSLPLIVKSHMSKDRPSTPEPRNITWNLSGLTTIWLAMNQSAMICASAWSVRMMAS